jgi:hypothetical protein
MPWLDSYRSLIGVTRAPVALRTGDVALNVHTASGPKIVHGGERRTHPSTVLVENGDVDRDVRHARPPPVLDTAGDLECVAGAASDLAAGEASQVEAIVGQRSLGADAQRDTAPQATAATTPETPCSPAERNLTVLARISTLRIH